MEDKPLILIVDDSTTNLQVLGNILRENGYRPAVSKNGKEAIDFAVKNEPDLILLDVMMPEMDGFETCRKLKEDNSTKNIPVIFITALTESDDKIKAFGAGGVDYITKPFMSEEVLARINVHINLRRVLDRLESIALVDDLTGVFNRRFAYENVYKHIENSRRNKRNMTLCYMDIDNLKIVNDRYGHQQGDELIKTFVKVVKSVIRETDILFRMGGDEFMLLFPETDLDSSKRVIKRVCDLLGDETVKDESIEFSYGFAEYNYSLHLTVDELIKIADEDMYRTKKEKKKSVIGRYKNGEL